MKFIDPLSGDQYTEIKLGNIYQGFSSKTKEIEFINDETVPVASVTINSDINDPHVSFAKSKDEDFDKDIDTLFFDQIYQPGEKQKFYVMLATNQDTEIGDNSITLNIEAYEQV